MLQKLAVVRWQCLNLADFRRTRHSLVRAAGDRWLFCEVLCQLRGAAGLRGAHLLPGPQATGHTRQHHPGLHQGDAPAAKHLQVLALIAVACQLQSQLLHIKHRSYGLFLPGMLSDASVGLILDSYALPHGICSKQ